MKLIHKTILGYLLIIVPLLIIAASVSYYLIRHELNDGIDENLEHEKFNAQQLIESLKEPASIYLSYDELSYCKIIDPHIMIYDTYSDTSLYYHKKKAHKKEVRHYRMLKSSFRYKDTNYLIVLARTTVEEDELMEDIFSAFVLVIVFLVLTFFGISLLLSKRLWKPFYESLALLEQYDLKNHAATHFKGEKVKEFAQLNQALNQMTEKIHRDFIQQKEFTENAAHEMQTPLAVVRANLSLLIQSPHIGEAEMNQLQAIENTVKKLSALNKALILLSKIENNQYPESQELFLAERFDSALLILEDFARAKKIQIHTRLDPEASIHMNPVLLDVLISNLLQNAIRHNQEDGTVEIVVQKNFFSVANTGAPLVISEEELFTRFKKNDASRDSLGLGLSIVKSIVLLYGMSISYAYTSGRHVFSLTFKG